MRILILSDIHVEFWRTTPEPFLPENLPSPDSYDLIVAAGDIGVGVMGLDWLTTTFPDKKILFVPGNHEYYRHSYDALRKDFAYYDVTNDNVVVLAPGSVVIDNVHFIGATLWSSLNLKGYLPLSHFAVAQGIADFRVIQNFLPERMVAINETEQKFISSELQHPMVGDDGKVVVITHFVPSQLAIAPKYYGNRFNPYFTQDMDYLIDLFQPNAWIYGHTHERQDIFTSGGTRLVGNPYGYPRENPEPYQFKIIEV